MLKFLIPFLLLPTISFAQFNYKTVIGEPYLSLRKGPKLNSKLLKKIPFGTRVKVKDQEIPKDTINDFIGSWKEVYFDGITGYCWDQYLSNQPIKKFDSLKQSYLITYEGMICGDISYDIGLNWYGLYETKNPDYQELRKIEVELVLWQKLSKTQLDSEFKGQFFGDYYLKTDQDEQSIFLIATKKILQEKLIPGSLVSPINKGNNENAFLYPEQIRTYNVDSGRISLSFKGYQLAYFDSATTTINQEYQLVIKKNKSEMYSQPGTKQQIITAEDIPLMKTYSGGVWLNAVYKNPNMYWVGDLDDDKQLDFAISSFLMKDTEGVPAELALFVSSLASPDEFVKHVATHRSYACMEY